MPSGPVLRVKTLLSAGIQNGAAPPRMRMPIMDLSVQTAANTVIPAIPNAPFNKVHYIITQNVPDVKARTRYCTVICDGKVPVVLL